MIINNWQQTTIEQQQQRGDGNRNNDFIHTTTHHCQRSTAATTVWETSGEALHYCKCEEWRIRNHRWSTASGTNSPKDREKKSENGNFRTNRTTLTHSSYNCTTLPEPAILQRLPWKLSTWPPHCRLGWSGNRCSGNTRSCCSEGVVQTRRLEYALYQLRKKK